MISRLQVDSPRFGLMPVGAVVVYDSLAVDFESRSVVGSQLKGVSTRTGNGQHALEHNSELVFHFCELSADQRIADLALGDGFQLVESPAGDPISLRRLEKSFQRIRPVFPLES
jgi:hypothetical protein